LRTDQDVLTPIDTMTDWHSPRLGIRFALEGTELRLFFPDGRRFLTMIEMDELRKAAELRVEEVLDRNEVLMESVRSAMRQTAAAAKRAEAEARRADVEAQAHTAAESRILALEEKLRQAGLL
ncbi:MAG: hypothetical protein M3Q45_09715, partial [Chloroflexota bacterium]|nr:hypothetical protein [Chloroflexota bacterium]